MNLSKLKKSLVSGTKLTVTWPWANNKTENRVVHSCSGHQLVLLKDDGDKSYLEWPPASQVKFTDNGFNIMEEDDNTKVAIQYQYRA